MSSPASKKKKKSRPNAYWCFAHEQQKVHRLWNLSKEDREARISDMWKNVDAEGRERYKRIAELMRNGASSEGTSSSSSSSRPLEPPILIAPPAPILPLAPQINDQPSQPPPSKKAKILKDSLGESIEERERREAEAKAYKKRMEQKVTKTIESAAEDGVIFNKNFHLISVVNFSHDSTGVVYPAEIALGKFSLVNGIHQRLHKKVNPGRLPADCSIQDALDKSHEEHKYLLPDDDDDDKTDFINLVQQILEFLQPETEIPIFYAKDDDAPMVKKALNMIFTRCGEGSETIDAIHVYSVERFLKVLSENVQRIRNAGVDVGSAEYKLILPSCSIASANSEFQRRFRPYEPCEFHSKNRAEDFCALAAVNGMGYLLAEVCCDKRHIEMIEGQHRPKKNRNAQEVADDDFTDI